MGDTHKVLTHNIIKIKNKVPTPCQVSRKVGAAGYHAG